MAHQREGFFSLEKTVNFNIFKKFTKKADAKGMIVLFSITRLLGADALVIF